MASRSWFDKLQTSVQISEKQRWLLIKAGLRVHLTRRGTKDGGATW
ncbi:hypothetical protein OROMI_001419 [Orobanche minor]